MGRMDYLASGSTIWKSNDTLYEDNVPLSLGDSELLANILQNDDIKASCSIHAYYN